MGDAKIQNILYQAIKKTIFLSDEVRGGPSDFRGGLPDFCGGLPDFCGGPILYKLFRCGRCGTCGYFRGCVSVTTYK